MIHMTILLKRKEGLTKAEFDDHWSNVHADVFMSNPVARSNLVKYSQQHVDPKANEKLAQMGVKISDADGVVHFYTETIEKLFEVFESEYYKNVVVPDNGNFIARGYEEMTIGIDDDKWFDGQTEAGVVTKA